MTPRRSVVGVPASVASLHWPDFDHVGQIVTQQILDAVAQRRSRGGPTGTGTLHVEIDHAIPEAAEGNVAAVVGDRRPYPCFNQFFYRGYGLRILRFEKLFACRRDVRAAHERR